MHIVLFLTRGMSLAAWDANGSLTRELALYAEFARRGHKISIISWGGAEESVYEGRFPWLKVYPNRWRLPQERYERLVPLLHARPLCRCDLIKSNQTNGADLALRAAEIWGKPFISRCGYLWGLNSARQNSARLPEIRRLEKCVFNGAARCLVTTEEMRQTIIQDYGVDGSKISVVPNYIPASFFAPALPEYNQLKARPVICYVGRLSVEKNLPAVLEACSALAAKLRLVGEGPEKQKLSHLAQELGVDLDLPGNLPHEKLPEILGQADICVLASQYEGHPKALLEYMGRGCAILATRVPGIEGLAVHERNALLCATDAASIRAGLERLLGDASLRAKLGEQAREDARAFSLDVVAGEELNLYSSIPRKSKALSLLGAVGRIFIKGCLWAVKKMKGACKENLSRVAGAIVQSFKARPATNFSTPGAVKLNSTSNARERLVGRFPAAAEDEELPDTIFIEKFFTEIRARTNKLTPAEALRLLFNLDAKLYTLQGRLAVAYGNGLHTKHRHTRYHDIFSERVSPGECVLDIGCGNGALAYDLAEKGALVTGIDLSEVNIHAAQNRFAHPNARYIHGDALVDLPAGEYATVVMSNVLEHLPERVAFLRSVQERLKPQRYLIRVPLFERDWRVPLKKELGVEWRLDATHETEYTIESFHDEIFAAGLTPAHQEIRWGEIWCELKPQ